MPLIPKDLSFLCRADLSIPTKSAVFDILPLCFFSWDIKYFFSKISLASFKGNEKLSSTISLPTSLFEVKESFI